MEGTEIAMVDKVEQTIREESSKQKAKLRKMLAEAKKMTQEELDALAEMISKVDMSEKRSA